MSTNNATTPQRVFEGPVAWLLGKQLLNSLKGILLYSAYGGKIDPRDWMTGKSFAYTTDKDEFWFDYLADSGDGMKAVYSIAYLAMSNLWTNLSPPATSLPAPNLPISFSRKDQSTFQLPRGEFVFFGGDTAYHAAEYMTLLKRIQQPFRWAYEDLRTNNGISDDDPRRNIFGIPGNHDYYDQLDGFRRQFRKPIRSEGPPPPAQSGPNNAQLSIPGFKRVQDTSYVAISLPFGWSIWGLDTESPVSDRHKVNLDRRQKSFFQSLSQANGEFRSPDKLILATCSPSTVFGRLADPDDPKVAKAMADLGLKRPFLSTAGTRDLTGTGDEQLSKGQCRLDLSGDVHHYARYWGPASAQNKSEKKEKKPNANSYASVVSGAGGAFHHPSTTFDGEIVEQALYPARDVSRKAVAETLFKFWNIFTGGRVWLFGLIIACTIYIGAAVTPSSRQFISQFRILRALNLTQPEVIAPTVFQPAAKPCPNVTPFKLWIALEVVDKEWSPPAECSQGGYTYFFSSPAKWPTDVVLGQIFTWTSLVVILITFGLAFTKLIFTDQSPFQKGTRDPAMLIWPILVSTTILVALGLLSLEPYRNYFTPFASSLLVLFSIIAAATAITLSIRYGDYRFKKSFVDGSGSKSLEIFCWIVAVTVIGFALLLFGRNNAPAFLISDIVFVLVLVGAVVAIILLPFRVAADLLYGKSPFVAYPGKFLIGLWHLILQLLVPFILIRNGNYLVWLIAGALLFASLLAQGILKNNWRTLLVFVWGAYGAVVLFLPKIVKSFYDEGSYHPLVELLTGWLGGRWGVLAAALMAGVCGAIICCLWTGWYFAVCFAFNGHNNEIGGAARIESFKQFIRFRLTKDGLTGYVIAVDKVDHIGVADDKGHIGDGNDLHPKLIDVFQLVPKR
jgi:hypothetical protein